MNTLERILDSRAFQTICGAGCIYFVGVHVGQGLWDWSDWMGLICGVGLLAQAIWGHE